MSFIISSDHYGLLRTGKKRALVIYLPLDGVPVSSLGLELVINEDKPTMQEPISIRRIAITTFERLTQEDASAAGYLYLHQLHQDLQKLHPDIEHWSLVQIVYFLRTAELEQ